MEVAVSQHSVCKSSGKEKTKEVCLQLKVKVENPSRSKVTDLTEMLSRHWTSSLLAENAKLS